MPNNDQKIVLEKIENEYNPLHQEFYNDIEPNFVLNKWYTEYDPKTGYKRPKIERYEFLYTRTFASLMIIAVLIREFFGKRGYWKINLGKEVKILREIKEHEPHSKLIFTVRENKEVSGGEFSQKVCDVRSMEEILNYIIHKQSGSWPYAEKDGKILELKGDTMIYVGIDTEKKPNIYINFSDLLSKIGEIIKEIKKL